MKAVIVCSLTMGLILFALFCGVAEAEEVRAGVAPPDTSCSPGAQIQVRIEIDVSDVSESLGAYSASLEWNPVVLEFVEISGGTSEGFTTLQSNQSEVSSGKVLFNQFNALGTGGIVHIARITFMVIGEIGQTTAIDLELSVLSAAHTFTNLLPLLTIEDGLINVVAPKIPDISLSANSYNFGDVQVGSSASWTLVVSNEGNASLSVSNISSSDAQFGASPISFNAAAGSSRNVTVTFTPASMGDKSGTLTISSNDPDEPTVTVSLSGRGLAPDGMDCGSDYYGDWVFYCDGDNVRKHRISHDFYYEGGSCKDHTSWADDQWVENCNDRDGWVDTGNTKWVTSQEYECKEDQKKQKEQEYRDYYCSGGSPTYKVTKTQWVDTGNTRTVNKPDGTDCGKDDWHDTEETRWIEDTDHPGSRKEQKTREYRDYFCSGGSCVYEVSDTTWEDTGWREYAIQTTDDAVMIKIDTTWHDSPETFKWEDDTDHEVEVLSVQNISVDSRYKFTHWSGKSTSTDTVISIDASAEAAGAYQADYKKQYILHVSTDPAELISHVSVPDPNDSPNWYDKGQALSLVAPEAVDTWIFGYWKVDGDRIEANAITVEMDSTHKVTGFYRLNHQPIAHAGNDTTVTAGATVTLNGSGTDADGDPLIYSWVVGSDNPTPVTLSSTTVARSTFTTSMTPGQYRFILTVNDGIVDSAPDTVAVTVQEEKVVHFRPMAVNTGVSYLIQVGNAIIDGVSLEAGDEIGVFTTQDSCAGAVVIPEGFPDIPVQLTAWGDNTQSSKRDGFLANELMSFKVWDVSEGREYAAVGTYLDFGGQLPTSGRFGDGQQAAVTLDAVTIISQSLNFAQGWNVISFNVQPDNLDAEVVMTPVLNSLAIMKNNAGQSLQPNFFGSGWINGIGDIDVRQGYQVYMKATGTLKVEGSRVNSATPIDLALGWNMVSYLPTVAVDAEVAVGDILQRLRIVKNNAGQSLQPNFFGSGWINGIGNMLPGQGYQLYASEACQLVYRMEVPVAKPSVVTSVAQEVSHFVFKSNTGSTYALLIGGATIDGVTLAVGDEIGVFTPAGLCAGAVAIPNGFPDTPVQLAAWGDDSQTEEVDGFVDGELMSFRIWGASAQREIFAEPAYLDFGGQLPTSGKYGDGQQAALTLVSKLVPAPPSNLVGFDTPNDQGHSITLTWTKSPDDGSGLNSVSYYRIYRSRSSELTDPIPITSFPWSACRDTLEFSPGSCPALDSLMAMELGHTIFIDSVAAGTTEYVDFFVPVNGVPYYYWLDAVAADGAATAKVLALFVLTAVDEEAVVNLPQEYFLYQNSPNPFNVSTQIRYRLPESSEVRLSIHNLLGQEVRRLVDGKMEAGTHSVLWDGRDDSGNPLASGVYLCRFRAGDFTQTKRIVLLR